MTVTTDLQTEAAEQQFLATTAEKYNVEYASGKVTGSSFPYHEVHSLPGYIKRNTPGLAAVDVTNVLARHLVEYAERNGCKLPYQQREISRYLWRQTSRGKLAWEEIFEVVRGTTKRDRHQPIAHYFGYRAIMKKKGTARDKKLIKLIRYITQEGECAGCRAEFRFDDLTLDRIKPRKANGTYNLRNVQLMCQLCNQRKGASYG